MSVSSLSSVLHPGQMKTVSVSSSHHDQHSLVDDRLSLHHMARPDQGHPHLRMAYLLNVIRRVCDDRVLLVNTWLEIIEGGSQYQDLWLWDEGDEEWIEKNVLEEGDYEPAVAECSIATLYPQAFRHAVSLLKPEDWDRARIALQSRLTRDNTDRAPLQDSPFMRMNVLAWLVLTSPVVKTVSQSTTGGRDGDNVIHWHLSARNLFRPSLAVVLWAPTLQPFFRSHGHTCLHDLRLVSDWFNLNDWVWVMCRLHTADAIEAFVRGMNSCDVCATRLGRLARQCRSQPVHGHYLNGATTTRSTAPAPSAQSFQKSRPILPSRTLSTRGLAAFQTTSCPSRCPAQWLEANRRHIVTIVQACEDLTEAEKSDCICMVQETSIYQRFLVHTYVELKRDDRDAFLNALRTWRSWDALTSLVRHQSIRDDLSSYVRAHTLYNEAHGSGLYTLDVIAIYATVLAQLRDPAHLRAILSLRGEEARSLLDLFQMVIDCLRDDRELKEPFLNAFIKLSKVSGLYPSCLTMRGVQKTGKYPQDEGRHGVVWTGLIRGQKVAIKVARVCETNHEQLREKFSREAAIWSQLHHPNLLPLYGVYCWDDYSQVPALVSPWMENGTIMTYLGVHPDADRINLTLDVAEGLEYLHSMNPPIIHGDLKGANILISPFDRACLADFGLTDSFRSPSVSNNGPKFGTIPYTAPELLNPPHNERARMTPATDMFALAGTYFEILTGNVPFHDSVNEPNVIWRIVHGEIPKRPLDKVSVARGLTDEMWAILKACWILDGKKRLSASETMRRIYDLPHRPKDLRPAGGWDTSATGLRSSSADHPFPLHAENFKVALRTCNPKDVVCIPAVFAMEARHLYSLGTT